MKLIFRRACQFFVVFFLYFLVVSPTQNILRRFYRPKSGPLYDDDDFVVILDQATLQGTIFGRDRAFFVEFYSSWCGHCINFAPKWKKLAARTRFWRPVIVVAALDCADKRNTESCRDFGVTSYPSMRLFPARATKNHKGLEVIYKQQGIEFILREMISFVTMHTGANRPESWPNFHRLNLTYSNVPELKQEFEETTSSLALVFENSSTTASKSVALDLSDAKNVRVLSVDVSKQNPEFIGNFAINEIPSVRFVDSDLSIDEIKFGFIDSYEWIEKVASLSSVRNIEPEIAPSDLSTKLRSPAFVGKSSFNVDLENMLRISLYQEIGSHQSLSGTKLEAVRAYVKVLLDYFPGSEESMTTLNRLDSWLKAERNSAIEIETWNEKIGSLPPEREWRVCRGSEPKYRGYPCSVWITFHVLTVSASLRNKGIKLIKEPRKIVWNIHHHQHLKPQNDSENDLFQPRGETDKINECEVLEAMYSYISNFFGCRHCAEHFSEMYKGSSEVKTYDEAVLWLWRAHNKVNERIKGDLSEDPVSPKMQFPSNIDCPSCYAKNGSWLEDEVLTFLKSHYGRFIDGNYRNFSFSTTPNVFIQIVMVVILVTSV